MHIHQEDQPPAMFGSSLLTQFLMQWPLAILSIALLQHKFEFLYQDPFMKTEPCNHRVVTMVDVPCLGIFCDALRLHFEYLLVHHLFAGLIPLVQPPFVSSCLLTGM